MPQQFVGTPCRKHKAREVHAAHEWTGCSGMIFWCTGWRAK
jgi:hypothetical protein